LKGARSAVYAADLVLYILFVLVNYVLVHVTVDYVLVHVTVDYVLVHVTVC